jgi:hypothetical protein
VINLNIPAYARLGDLLDDRYFQCVHPKLRVTKVAGPGPGSSGTNLCNILLSKLKLKRP